LIDCRLPIAYCLLHLAVGGQQSAISHQQLVPNPTVTAAVTGGERGQAFAAFTDATRPAGYIEEEHFFSGKATAYVKSGSWGVDGRWIARPGSTADYKVRMLVRRPSDPKRFNGVLLVEWLNVTANAEGAADYIQMAEEITRSGYAWVGIGAQASGVNAPRTGLKAWDPTRYAPLVHPGDAYSYDIFSQGAQALLHPNTIDPLGGLRVRQMIATGRSQSAFRLVTYINAVHSLARLFNGYFVHSRGANAAGLSAEQLARDVENPIPPGAHIRSDMNVPVFDLQTEGDMLTLGAHLTRQEPGPYYRRWEIAGAAHTETARWVVDSPDALDRGPGCKMAVNAVPHHAVVKAALVALTRWVRDGVVPRQSPAIELGSPAALDPALVRDSHGNAKGGIRLPELEVPTARLDGRRNEVANAVPGVQNFCFLYGTTELFDAATLTGLYPTHNAFVKKFSAAADSLVSDGYWLRPEAEAAKAAARRSSVGQK
jgi:alpha/beta hydrolase family protein